MALVVVDSSAVVAILFGEPAAEALLDRLLEDSQRVMSVASYVETGTVLAGRLRTNRIQAIEDLDIFFDAVGVVLAPVDETRRGGHYGRAFGLAEAWAPAAC